MKKIFLILGVILSVTAINAQTEFHNFKITDIDGEAFDFSQLKGKKVMIVNTASKCSSTIQYEMLQVLYEKYSAQNFVVIGFPANNFHDTEPGDNADIRKFCTLNYHVNFPLMGKSSVKGEDMSEVYQWLTSKDKNGVMDSEVEWNFQKYLINEEGVLEKVLAPGTKPYDKEIINWIKG
ncbi:glutathione peroxidase [Labilibacter marinus]|uniref:glutathione peroxidase n=1 Tax=Labilibacter marinus TaxID=1477105 RepID=UPI0009FB55D4|nr:glutathione peroxidase [Labilibacter marinus]